MGCDAHRYLLTPLAENNFGFATYIDDACGTPDMQSIFDKISHPALSEISVNISGGSVDSLYPVNLPDIYPGEQLAIFGRYNSAGPVRVQLSGSTAPEPTAFAYNGELSADSTENHFIMQMWAKKLLEDLIGQLAAFEETSLAYKTITRKIIDVSLKYGIMTPFTSFEDPGYPTLVQRSARLSTVLPTDFQLEQNYPNPFNSGTKFKLRIERLEIPGQAMFIIYNLLGPSCVSNANSYSIAGHLSNQLGRTRCVGQEPGIRNVYLRAEISGANSAAKNGYSKVAIHPNTQYKLTSVGEIS